MARHLELCLTAAAAETACSSGVQYGTLIEPMSICNGEDCPIYCLFPAGFTYVLYGIFPYANRLRLSLLPARVMQLLPKTDRLAERRPYQGFSRFPSQDAATSPAVGEGSHQLPEMLLRQAESQRARVVLFTGCVADAMFRQVHWATARVLQANGCEVLIPRTQGCCGAIHYHSGAGGPTLDFARQNADALLSSEVDAIIVNVAGCGSMLKDYGHIADELGANDDRFARFASKVQDVTEFLMELGPVAPTTPVPLKATYHDACHLCHAQKITEQPRRLLSMIPGLELLPLDESDICCGAAGSYNLTEPEMAIVWETQSKQHPQDRSRSRHLSQCRLHTANPGPPPRNGHPLPVLHPVELLDQPTPKAHTFTHAHHQNSIRSASQNGISCY
ncbi:MAG: (Fe-S)-binding protein [Planctomycetaceae bacterium]